MRSTVEKLEGLALKLKIVVPKDIVQNVYNQHLKDASHKVNLKGFRPGKVPLAVIQKRFGPEVQNGVLSELIETSFKQALDEHKIQVAGQPKIKPPQFVLGRDLEYEAICETLPDVDLHDLTNIAIQKVTAEVTDEDIARMIKNLQQQNADWVVVHRAAKQGDRVKIDFEGFIDNKAIPHGSAQNFTLILGSNQMIPGFEEGIVGMKEGEKKDLLLSFPENYPDPNIAAKKADFKLTLHTVEEPKLPSMDDELPKKLQVQGGYAALKEEVRKQMERGLAQSLGNQLRSTVLEKLLERNPINIPQSLVESEARYLQHINQQQHEMMRKRFNPNLAVPEIPREAYVQEAEKRVRLGLLLAEIIKRHQIQRDPDRVRERLNNLALNYPDPNAVLKNYSQNKELMAEVEAAVLEEQVVEKLLETAKVELKTISYDEAMNAKT